MGKAPVASLASSGVVLLPPGALRFSTSSACLALPLAVGPCEHSAAYENMQYDHMSCCSFDQTTVHAFDMLGPSCRGD